MLSKVYNAYALLFGRPRFEKLNKLLYNLSIRGLGVLNYQTEKLRGEFYWLQTYLKNRENPCVVDVGANIGNYTKDVLKIKPDTFVYVFEPHPLTFKKLNDTLSGYENIKIFNNAVGDEEGVLELFDYKNNDGSSHASLYKDVIKDLHGGEVISHKVEIVKLDDILKNIKHDIDLLKIDTEGNEYKVLLGANEFLRSDKIKAIHFEFNEMNIVSKTSFKDFWDLLSKDFYFYRILPYGRLLHIKNYSPITCELYHYQNIICIKKEL